MGLSVAAAACGGGASVGAGGTPGSPATSSPGPGAASSAPGGGIATSPPLPTTALGTALTTAYRAETTALATYQNVIAKLGSVGPFPNIVPAEQQHVAAISALLGRYGVKTPAPGAGQAAPATLPLACSAAVGIEQSVIAMYNAQLASVTSYPDVTAAFDNLKAASQNNHLPAFQRCA